MLRVLVVIVALMAVLTAIYVALGVYTRWERARELEAEHAAGKGRSLTREDYVQQGLVEYDRSLRKRLLIGIFATPVLVFIGLVVIANYY